MKDIGVIVSEVSRNGFRDQNDFKESIFFLFFLSEDSKI